MKSPFRHWLSTDHLPKDREVSSLPTKMIPFMWYFIRQAKWQFLAITIIWSLSHGLETLGPYFIKLLIDAFNANDPSTIWDAILPILPYFIGLFLIVQPIFARVGNAMISDVRPALADMIRRQLALYMHRHFYHYFQSDFAGRIASKVIETPLAIVDVLQTLITSLGYALVSLLMALWMFTIADPVFSYITLVWLVLYSILMVVFVPVILEKSKDNSDCTSLVRGRYVDSLTNILTVKLFGRKKHEDQYYLSALKDNTTSGRKIWHTINHMQIWLELISSLYIGSIFFAAVTYWKSGDISVGDVAMILPLMLRVMNISWWVSDTLTHLFERLGQVQEGMDTIFAAKVDSEIENARTLTVPKANIEIKDVDFSYDSISVFKNLTISIPAGQKIGLVGRSGAGKTTLGQMLLRLFEIQSGKISIDNQDIQSATKQSLRENIGIIPQDTSLFHRSLMDNIRYGRLDASDEEVIEASKRAHAHEFIADLPQGYETLVGERGVKLSGGQRQRIAIARAILKDAPILILDEATSALDSESEKLIQDSLKTLMEGKTVIAIAHRLSTIAHLDRLIVMHEGAIVEDGTHDDLRAKKDGHYAKLWAMQSGGFLGE